MAVHGYGRSTVVLPLKSVLELVPQNPRLQLLRLILINNLTERLDPLIVRRIFSHHGMREITFGFHRVVVPEMCMSLLKNVSLTLEDLNVESIWNKELVGFKDWCKANTSNNEDSDGVSGKDWRCLPRMRTLHLDGAICSTKHYLFRPLLRFCPES